MCLLCENFEKPIIQYKKGDVVFAQGPMYVYFGDDEVHPAPLIYCPTCGRKLFDRPVPAGYEPIHTEE